MAKIPKHYQLKAEHPNSFEIHDKRDGKSFHVAKKALDLQMHAKLAGIPHYDEGTPAGPVGSPGDIASQALQGTPITNAPAVAPSTDWSQQDAPSVGGASADWSEAPNIPSQLPDKGAPADASAPVSKAPLSAEEQFGKNQQDALKGLQAMGAAKVQQSKDDAEQIAASNYAMQGFMNQANDDKNLLDSRNTALMNDIATSKIDPNNFVHNMGTGNKIMSAIAIGLGSIGAGLSGDPNIAAGILQKSIADDIDAQKADLGKKQSLLSANMQQYGNLERATAVTTSQMNAMAQGRLAQIAAKNGGAINQGNYQYLTNNLKNEQMIAGKDFAASMFQQRMKEAALKGGFGPATDPATLVQYLVPKEHQQKAFDQIEAAQNTSKLAPKILEAFDNAANNLHAADFLPGVDNVDQKSLHALMGPTFKDVEGTVRQAAMDNMAHNTTPAFGETAAQLAKKRQDLVEYLTSKSSAPDVAGYGINLKNYKSTTFNADPNEGKIASNAKGQKLVMKNGSWVPLGK